MNKTTSRTAVIYRIVAGLLGWFALGLQLYLIIVNNNVPAINSIINFFSYYTILTNTLVALALTWPLISPHSGLGRFFARITVQSALALHIAIVGITYSLLLRHIWDPQGLQLVADRLLHDVMPILYLLYWFIFVPKGTLHWRNLPSWLIFPLIYCMYSLVRGPIANWYPYPFMNVAELGYQKVITNCLVMVAAFVAIGLIIIALDRMIGGTRKAGVAS
jgi:hypothetical protein